MLTGKYQKSIPKGSRFGLEGYEWLKRRYESEEGRARIEKVAKMSQLIKLRDLSLSQAAIIWCMKNQDVSTVILGSSKLEQLKENIACVNLIENFDDNLVKQMKTLFS